jgi:hypothetical protein
LWLVPQDLGFVFSERLMVLPYGSVHVPSMRTCIQVNFLTEAEDRQDHLLGTLTGDRIVTAKRLIAQGSQ